MKGKSWKWCVDPILMLGRFHASYLHNLIPHILIYIYIYTRPSPMHLYIVDMYNMPVNFARSPCLPVFVHPGFVQRLAEVFWLFRQGEVEMMWPLALLVVCKCMRSQLWRYSVHLAWEILQFAQSLNFRQFFFKFHCLGSCFFELPKQENFKGNIQ